MSGYTKGPWTAVIGECAQVRDAENALVATFHHITADGCRRDSHDVANAARLCAAAPELLKMLKSIVERYSELMGRDCDRHDFACCVSSAEDVIGKLEGR